MKRSLGWVMGAAVIAWSLVGCSGGTHPSSNPSPWADAFAEASKTESSYVQSVLADGKVTASELSDAQGHVIQCLADAGIEAKYQTDEWGQPMLTTPNELNEQQLEIDFACENQWMGSIGILYWGVLTNPDRLSPSDAIAACLVRNGLAPAGFTGKDWDEVMAPFTTTGNGDTPTHAAQPDGSAAEAKLPGGTSIDDWNVVGCRMNPSHDMKAKQ